MWLNLPRFDKASEIIKFGIDLVERHEGKKVPVSYEASGFVNEEKWKMAHEKYPNDVGKYDAVSVTNDRGEHAIFFRKEKFEKHNSEKGPAQSKIYLLEVTVRECLHILGYNDEREVDSKTSNILEMAMTATIFVDGDTLIIGSNNPTRGL